MTRRLRWIPAKLTEAHPQPSDSVFECPNTNCRSFQFGAFQDSYGCRMGRVANAASCSLFRIFDAARFTLASFARLPSRQASRFASSATSIDSGSQRSALHQSAVVTAEQFASEFASQFNCRAGNAISQTNCQPRDPVAEIERRMQDFRYARGGG